MKTDVPVIVTDYVITQQLVTEGDPLPLSFVVDSNPVATYTYHKDGVPLASAPSMTTVNQPDPSWFTVRQTGLPYSSTVTPEMSGKYNVTACNSLGCVTSQVATLIVQCKLFLSMATISEVNFINNSMDRFLLNNSDYPSCSGSTPLLCTVMSSN